MIISLIIYAVCNSKLLKSNRKCCATSQQSAPREQHKVYYPTRFILGAESPFTQNPSTGLNWCCIVTLSQHHILHTDTDYLSRPAVKADTSIRALTCYNLPFAFIQMSWDQIPHRAAVILQIRLDRTTSAQRSSCVTAVGRWFLMIRYKLKLIWAAPPSFCSSSLNAVRGGWSCIKSWQAPCWITGGSVFHNSWFNASLVQREALTLCSVSASKHTCLWETRERAEGGVTEIWIHLQLEAGLYVHSKNESEVWEQSDRIVPINAHALTD